MYPSRYPANRSISILFKCISLWRIYLYWRGKPKVNPIESIWSDRLFYFCSLGSQELIDKLFPGCEVTPDEGYNLALQFNCDSLTNPQEFLDSISELKRHIAGGPLDRAFTALLNKSSQNLPLMVVEYRKAEAMFICSSSSKVTIIFQIHFNDVTDQCVAKVFLQEFVEAQRSVRTAPPVIYSRDPPGELSGLSYDFKSNTAGFISFALEERHITGSGKEKAITLLIGFRNYLHYHIKCSKTYLHMRMRKRVAGWMQVLNRAVPEVETEKKTAGGKTFERKWSPFLCLTEQWC